MLTRVLALVLATLVGCAASPSEFVGIYEISSVTGAAADPGDYYGPGVFIQIVDDPQDQGMIGVEYCTMPSDCNATGPYGTTWMSASGSTFQYSEFDGKINSTEGAPNPPPSTCTLIYNQQTVSKSGATVHIEHSYWSRNEPTFTSCTDQDAQSQMPSDGPQVEQVVATLVQ